ncbi:chemotaxis response regulator protein-glutamate methylesterase [Aliikangiella sp. G2MR2-5]|uniref:protein-glutamate methylesterase/protein-glutamine glutaminase n=1 Tax=Aliikangiella sp. G2MR2-5 TaxID=2788943 RepID=UPI0018A9D494|nr:chemotaxis response regulator protein-glutamate methylesterase [Aliikangiella sp. G2MR2-5]
MATASINVLVVDDSALIRMLLSQILESDEDINVVATANDPYEAREKIKRYNPDVITLDVEMPRMDGITFLKNLMRLRPMPVVMVSSLTQDGAQVTLDALAAGAFDFVAKPTVEVKEKLKELSEELIRKVKEASKCNRNALDYCNLTKKGNVSLLKRNSAFEIIAVGASTGGTEAIQNLVKRLPTNLPPIVMAQHIPDVFSTSYAKRLDSEVAIEVIEVRTPQILESGCAYLAPGHMHMKVKKNGAAYFAYLSDEEPVNRHKPSVDVLFDSVANAASQKSIGILLTGMGQDGAKGLLNLKTHGAITIAQDEESSVVWGMPGAAVKMGAVNRVVSLSRIPETLVELLSE